MRRFFILVSENSVTKTEISVTGQAQFFIWTGIKTTKERVARRDFGNRTSLIDRAHRKRPKRWLSHNSVITVASLGLLAVFWYRKCFEDLERDFPRLIKFKLTRPSFHWLINLLWVGPFGGIKVRSTRAYTSAHNAVKTASKPRSHLHHLPTNSHHANRKFGISWAYDWNDSGFSLFPFFLICYKLKDSRFRNQTI